MTDGALHVGFPGETFISQAEFESFCSAQQSRLDSRFAYEQTLASAGSGLIRTGSCAPCLRVARYSTAAGTATDWRDGQVCDCDDRLGNRARAMLHFLEASASLDPWSRVALLGPMSPLDTRLARGRPAPIRLPRLEWDSAHDAIAGYRLPAADGDFSLAVSWDYLHHVPPLQTALAEICRVLQLGGRFVFSLPFHYRASHTISRLGHIPRRAGRLPAEFRGEIHEIGWDILAMLRQAGFSGSRAHHHWSDELGYLGAFNLLFSADK
jgi:SAM-dependent methyltransferase